MQRYFLLLSYEGSSFAGWQRQPNAVGVQEVLEEAFSRIFGVPVAVFGSSRTDAGVHALGQVAHFDAPRPLDEGVQHFLRRLSSVLPAAVVPRKLSGPHPITLHARHQACGRHYRYYVHLCDEAEGAVLAGRSHALRSGISDAGLVAMNQGAALCLDHQAFGAFARSQGAQKHHNCTLWQAHWHRLGANQWVFDVRANRFLRGMVRALAGSLLEVGKGRLALDEWKLLLKAADHHAAKHSLPPHGLYLVAVNYPLTSGLHFVSS